ncbi:YLS9 protein [Spatholobus suberectus]|nr:YLS9 protein [Spatholobus suberectus]
MSQLNGAYYGPSIPPPRKSYHRPSRGGGCLSCCCGCIFNCILGLICKILTAVIVVAAVVAVLFWLIVRPNVVKFRVTDAALAQFAYGNNNTLRYDLALNVSIRNPNRRVGIYYDDVEALALYQDVRFGSQTLGPFFQHHKNTTVLSPVFKGQHVVPLGADQVSELDKEKGSGVYSIDVKLLMTVRFKFVLFKTGNVKPKIQCELHVPLKSPNGTDAVFQATQCDWDYKRWWFH